MLQQMTNKPPALDLGVTRDASGMPSVSPADQLRAAQAAVTAPTHVLGTALSNADRAKAIASYVHRWTKDHVPVWATSPIRHRNLVYMPQFAGDKEWLDTTLFPVNKKGRLIDGPCLSTPTWPDGQVHKNLWDHQI